MLGVRRMSGAQEAAALERRKVGHESSSLRSKKRSTSSSREKRVAAEPFITVGDRVQAGGAARNSTHQGSRDKVAV